MRRYSNFQEISEYLSDLLIVSKIMFSANLLDIIESRGPVLSYDSPPSTVIFVRFDYGKGVGYVLLCCKDMLVAAAAREESRKVFGEEALRLIRSRKGTSYVYGVMLENIPENLRSGVEKAVSECRELSYPDALLETQLYGLKIGNDVLMSTDFIVVLPAELDSKKHVLILPSDTFMAGEFGRITLASLALDFSIALVNNVSVSGIFIPRTTYDKVNDLVTAPPSIAISWANAFTLASIMRQGRIDIIKDILKKAAQYLSRAHEVGVTHLWLDPQKILVTLTPDRDAPMEVFISGFLGRFPKKLVKFVNPSYCDPYVLLGAGGTHTDTYSLGMMILEAVTGSTLETRAEIVLALRDALMNTQPGPAGRKSGLYSLIFSAARKDLEGLRDVLNRLVGNHKISRRDKAVLAKVKNRELRDTLARCLSLNIKERPTKIEELVNSL